MAAGSAQVIVGVALSTLIGTAAVLSAVSDSGDEVVTVTVPATGPDGLAGWTRTTSRKVAEASASRASIVAVTVPVPPAAGESRVNAGPVNCTNDWNVVP